MGNPVPETTVTNRVGADIYEIADDGGVYYLKKKKGRLTRGLKMISEDVGKKILYMHGRGMSNEEIAKYPDIRLDKKTVDKYVDEHGKEQAHTFGDEHGESASPKKNAARVEDMKSEIVSLRREVEYLRQEVEFMTKIMTARSGNFASKVPDGFVDSKDSNNPKK